MNKRSVLNKIFFLTISVFSVCIINPAPAASLITLNRTQLNFAAAGSVSTGSQYVLLSASSWSASVSDPMIHVSPSAGSGDGPVTVWVDPAGLATGIYTGTVTITDAGAANSPQNIDINLTVLANDFSPFGAFGTPLEGSTVSGVVPVTGWALDDIEVENVKIYCEQDSSLVFLANASFADGSRPDVAAAYPDYPFKHTAGWGYSLVTGLLADGDGSYKIYAIASDGAGNETTLGSKTIMVDNANATKPFGKIDTPEMGAAASGNSYVLSGWCLTPLPNTIATDGSGISVWVDGINAGIPMYNISRDDIAAQFPGYANAGGAGWSFFLDTTMYANGVHSIYVVAQDNAGNSDGIGSRYFNIMNTVYPLPEIDVKGNGVVIADNDTTPDAADYTDFGTAFAGTGSVARMFTIENTGSDSLNLVKSPLVSVSGPGAADFSITAQPSSPVAMGGGTTTFEVTFSPGTDGPRTATISIASNDPDEGSYDFMVQGTGQGFGTAAAIPTLSQWGMIVMILLLSIASLVVLRGSHKG